MKGIKVNLKVSKAAYFSAFIGMTGLFVAYIANRSLAVSLSDLYNHVIALFLYLMIGSFLYYRFQRNTVNLFETSPDYPTRRNYKLLILFLIIFCGIFISRALINIDIKPVPIIDVNWEAANMENIADQILQKRSLDILDRYNLGLGPLYVPFLAIFGHSILMSKLFFVGYYLICLVLFFLIYHHFYPYVNPLATYTLIAPYCFIFDCLAKHKWHSVILLSTIGYYLAALGSDSKHPRIYWMCSWMCVIFSGVLYRGALIILPLQLFMAILDNDILRKKSFYRFFLPALLILSFVLMFRHPHSFFGRFYDRIIFQLHEFDLSKRSILQIGSSYFKYLFPPREFWLYPMLMLIGFVYSLVNFKKDRFARYTCALTMFISAGLFVSNYGLANWDENAYFALVSVALIQLGFVGVYQGIGVLFFKRRNWIITGLFLLVCIGIQREWSRNNTERVLNARHECVVGSAAFLHLATTPDTDDDPIIHVFLKKQLPMTKTLTRYPVTQDILNRENVVIINKIEDVVGIIEENLTQMNARTVKLYLQDTDLQQNIRSIKYTGYPFERTLEYPLNTNTSVNVFLFRRE
ncbi:hypothetical protein JW823_09795 [bacterium]|nr:hypothetical protein [candidate division CSSED10-310 bacterium]